MANNLLIKKDLNRLIADAGDPNVEGAGHMKRTLTAFNLTTLGIGAIIGAGIFALTGTAAAYYAGPGIVYSFVIGGILCAFAGLCYAELAAMVPIAGSAYSYSYATMGELIAWIIGWDLILEYGFGAVTVSTAWSGYFLSLLHKTLGIEFSDTLIEVYQRPLGDGDAGRRQPGLGSGTCPRPASPCFSLLFSIKAFARARLSTM